jgi:myosin heavy subunit
VFAKSLTAAQGAVTRDATARYVYKRLFEWALQAANDSLASAAGADSLGALASTVGVLDIFGFENLGHNSFEQLCINYSAEVLHKVRSPCPCKCDRLLWDVQVWWERPVVYRY